jgi:CTP synthase
VKIDPYLNVDAGTMNPTEHGEVFVLNSGLETDQDMGNYERFLNRDLPSEDYMTSGMVYKAVIDRERNLGYSGKCVEAIPHIRDEIIRRLERAAAKNGSEMSVIEIGGTVGDYQNIMFIEAARVMSMRHPNNVIFVLVSYLPVPGTLGEMKTKPTQNAIRQLNSYGVQPEIVVARAPHALDARRKEKIALQCSIKPTHVISAPDVKSIYDVPLNFERDKLSDIILQELGLRSRNKSNLSAWRRFAKKAHNGSKSAKIALVGKYFDTGDFVLSDAYISVIEALKASGYAQDLSLELTWLDAKAFERGGAVLNKLKEYDGILVPGGFGETGVEGKIAVIKYAREKKIPYFGLCYGMQLMVVEYARNVAKLKGAHTVEVNSETPHPIIDVMPDQKEKIANKNYGGSMRLGAYPCYLKRGTIARKAYKAEIVEERHRHRYEVNPEYIERLEKAGIVFSGVSPNKRLMEIMELSQKEHPFFVGTQFHPEFKSRPLAPHPLFTAFIKAAGARVK